MENEKQLTIDNGHLTKKDKKLSTLKCEMSNVLGFTLIELLVAITIVAILAAIGLTAYSSAISKARDSQRLDDARKIIVAIEQYRADNRVYPGGNLPAGTTTNCYDVNSSCTSSCTSTTWLPGISPNYLPSVPCDPKNNASPAIKYYYKTNDTGSDYCLQISQETDASNSRNFVTGSSNPWKLNYGPSGPTGIGSVCSQL